MEHEISSTLINNPSSVIDEFANALGKCQLDLLSKTLFIQFFPYLFSIISLLLGKTPLAYAGVLVKFCVNLHTRRVYNHTGFDVTDYFWSAVIDVQKLSKLPHSTASLLYISRTVRARITQFYGCNKANLPYIGTGYDVTGYFRSEARVKRQPKMPLKVEFLENCLSEDRQISHGCRG